MARYIVYEMRGGAENLFRLDTAEDERHERAQAEREMHSRDTAVLGYHFEDIPGLYARTTVRESKSTTR